MTNIVVIHQPDFLPYVGFFHKLLMSDLWIVFDDVQFLRRGWHHRDKIKTANGTKWLTLNIKKAPRTSNINNIQLSYHNNWREHHLNIIRSNYSETSAFSEIFPYIEQLYAYKYDKLIDMNMASIDLLIKLFDIQIDVEYSSQYKTRLTSNERLIELLKQVNASHYLTGTGAKDYFLEKPFIEANIQVIWDEFQYPVYPQLYDDFIPYLSSIDLLFNCGIEASRKILRSLS